MRRLLTLAVCISVVAQPAAESALKLADESDRNAFRAWFTFLADAQFERPTPDVTDCASLVRHAYREALRPHSPEWYRTSRLPLITAIPDVRVKPRVDGAAWLLFRVSREPERYAEFADAATIARLNARLVGRNVAAAQPGDLLFFRQEAGPEGPALRAQSPEGPEAGPEGPALRQRAPHHLMVVVGVSRFEPQRRDWIVYHTGPSADGPGEVRKASAADLMKHPSPRWRPVSTNPAFVGVLRLNILDRER